MPHFDVTAVRVDEFEPESDEVVPYLIEAFLAFAGVSFCHRNLSFQQVKLDKHFEVTGKVGLLLLYQGRYFVWLPAAMIRKIEK